MTGRVALVTGAARGIGRAVVERLVADGCTVVGTHHTSPPPSVAGPVHWRQVDLSDEVAVDELVPSIGDELGPVSVLVSNAAALDDGSVLRMGDEQYASVLHLNTVVPERLAVAAMAAMRDASWGRLVFVSSVGGLIGSAGQANYASSKAALVGLSAALAVEGAPHGVTANVVAPGPVDTELLRSMGDARLDELRRSVPSGRLGAPAEVAACVGFLCSDEAAFVNGAVLAVDGGVTATGVIGTPSWQTPRSRS